MKRRDFLAIAALLSASPALATVKKKGTHKAIHKTAHKPPHKLAHKAAAKAPAPAVHAVEAPPQPPRDPLSASAGPNEPPARWRNYELTSTFAIRKTAGQARLWLPLPLYKDTPWQRLLGHQWQGNFDKAGIYRDPAAETEVFYAEWKDGTAPQLTLSSQFGTVDRHFDVTRPGTVHEQREILHRGLRATDLIPTDGLIRRTAEQAIGRIKDPVAKGKAIYDWVVDNTSYDPKAPGCGSGNVAAILESGRLAGKSADIAGLFVGLCRAIGIPARPVYGLRIDESRLFPSLGRSGRLSLAQHCRAEFFAPGYGWIPVDPSDVKKAIAEERLSVGDSKVVVLKKLLFGFWEMNWVGLNTAQDVTLRGASAAPQPFLAYPQAETADGRIDPLDPEHFSYQLTAKRIEV